jgi:hypothetical protein
VNVDEMNLVRQALDVTPWRPEAYERARAVLRGVMAESGPLPEAAPVPAVALVRGRGISRARNRRRGTLGVRGKVGIGAGVAAVAAAAAVVLAATSTPQSAGHPASRPAREPAVRASLAAWSVHKNADGTVTLTINEIFQQPGKLRQALASAGVPAVVLVDKTCAGGDRYARDLDKIITIPDGRKPVFVIEPSAIPADTELVFTESWDPRGFGAADFALYPRGAALQCQTTYASQLISPSPEASPSLEASPQPAESASAVPSSR